MALEHQKSADSSENAMFSWIQINRHYFRTLPGVVKIIQLIIGVICLILASPAIEAVNQWFSYIIIIAIVVTALWCFIFLLSAKDAISFPIDWPLTEMLNMVFLAIIIAITSTFQIAQWSGAHREQGRWKNIFGGIFGIIDALLYLVSTCLSYADWRQTHLINS